MANNKIISIYATLFLANLSSCNSQQKNNADQTASSETKDVELSTVDLKNLLGPKASLLTGYRLSFKSQIDSGKCTNVEQEDGLTDSLKLKATLKNGCDYVLKLEMGLTDSSVKKLVKTYLTNRLPADKDQVVTAASLEASSRIQVIQHLTDDAKADGFSNPVPSTDNNADPSKVVTGLTEVSYENLKDGIDLSSTTYSGMRVHLRLPGYVQGRNGQPNSLIPDCIGIQANSKIDDVTAAYLTQKIRVKEGSKWTNTFFPAGNRGETHDLNYQLKNGRIVYFLSELGFYESGITLGAIDQNSSLLQALLSQSAKNLKVQYLSGCNF